jgi:hypothetical protein
MTTAESTYARLIPRRADLRNVLISQNANYGGTEMNISELVNRNRAAASAPPPRDQPK